MRKPLACLLLGLVACVAPPSQPQQVSEDAAVEGAKPPPPPPPWAEASVVESTTGRWEVRWVSTPTWIPDNEPFELRVWVFDSAGELADVELAVDAAMPQHGHGMNRVPEVVPGEDGGFLVDGLLFHMPGRWELYFDITQGALTERAQVVIEFE